jgi:Tfp pilus assembly protein PilW
MKHINFQKSKHRNSAGLSLLEVMIASGLGSMVLACVASLAIYGSRSSVALMNYTDLDAKSRYAADVISRELRQGYAVLALDTNLPVKALTLTNSVERTAVTLTWDADDRTLVFERNGEPPVTLLTECDRWEVGLYQRTPIVSRTNLLFFPATNTTGRTDLRLCKLINMSWKCSRTILAQKVNTETVQAAQIVLRNKP